MKEDFLHYVWKFQKFSPWNLSTQKGIPIRIVDPGIHNHLAGPDFSCAKVRIGEELWVGTIEIHTKSSHWYAHGHEKDANYNGVVLHVVWDHDVEVYRMDGSHIPTLSLKSRVPKLLLERFWNLSKVQDKWIRCEGQVPDLNSIEVEQWFSRLYVERLEQKSLALHKALQDSQNHWEVVCFKWMSRGFGSLINASSFFEMAHAIDFNLVGKLRKQEELEALFMGMVGLLNSEEMDTYFLRLQDRFDYFKHVYGLSCENVPKAEFFKLRPPNFPTIRLSQLANLYVEHGKLFSKLMVAGDISELYSLLSVRASSYWQDHYNFGIRSSTRSGSLSKRFKDHLIINTIIPLKFCFARHRGVDVLDELFNLLLQIPKENNNVVKRFSGVLAFPKDALSSQAIVQLKTQYCDKNRCLQCAIGTKILEQ